MTEPLTLSVMEAARLLGCGRNHLYGMIHRGEIPHVRFGRVIRIPRPALERWLLTQADSAVR